MNINTKHTVTYTLDLTEMEIAILINALGKTREENYETLCQEYNGTKYIAKTFDTVAQNMYDDMRSRLSMELGVVDSLDEIYTTVIEHSKD